MHFDTGKFGAVVIVVSLILTIVLGYCTDVTKVEVDRTDYDYITDITGLFETEQVPDYIEYNPNSNYVGYTGDIIYSPSNQPNNYRYVVAPGQTTTATDTLWYNEIRSAPSEMGQSSSVFLHYTGSEYSLRDQFFIYGSAYNVLTNVIRSGALHNASVSTLYDILTEGNLDLSGSQTATIDFSVNMDYPVFILPLTSFTRGYEGTYEMWRAEVNDNNVLDRVEIDPITYFARGYVNDVEVWSGASNQFVVVYSYQANDYLGQDNHVPLRLTMDATITAPPLYGYADPQGGVRLAPGQTVTWDNGYEIERISLLVGKYNYPQQSAMYFEFYDSPGSSYNANLWVSISNNGVEINIYDHRVDDVSSINLGKWTGVLLTYDRITGIITATPTGMISDYTTIPRLLGETVQLTTGWTSGESIPTNSGFTAYTSGAGGGTPSPMFGVVETTVDLNTYNVVMNDPSINIQEYWPNLDQYRLNFYSFALVGESIRINNVTYPVSATQTITVTDVNGDEYTRTLSNIYITTEIVDETEHTLLTFANDGLTVDLGETVSEVVAFDGLWYFTTALYEVVRTTGTEYEWNIDGTFNASAQQVLVIFLGLLAVGVLVGKVALRQDIGFLDWILIIGAGVVALAMSGVFF